MCGNLRKEVKTQRRLLGLGACIPFYQRAINYEVTSQKKRYMGF